MNSPGEDAGGKTTGAGGESVDDRGGLYVRDWGDEEEPRPEHPDPPEPARPADRSEYGRTLSGIVRGLGPGWRVLRVDRSIGYVPLARAPWFREEPGACVLAVFVHDGTRVRAHGLWLPTTKRGADGAFGLGYESGAMWRTCTDPDCPTRELTPVHPSDVPAPLDSDSLRALLAGHPGHVTDDRTTWRAP